MSRWKLNKKQVINFTWNLDNLTLDWCDLDQEYNILEAPECDCGCGEKAKLCLYNDEDVKDFCKGMAEVGAMASLTERPLFTRSFQSK